jgi:hypothetical protein
MERRSQLMKTESGPVGGGRRRGRPPGKLADQKVCTDCQDQGYTREINPGRDGSARGRCSPHYKDFMAGRPPHVITREKIRMVQIHPSIPEDLHREVLPLIPAGDSISWATVEGLRLLVKREVKRASRRAAS